MHPHVLIRFTFVATVYVDYEFEVSSLKVQQHYDLRFDSSSVVLSLFVLFCGPKKRHKKWAQYEGVELSPHKVVIFGTDPKATAKQQQQQQQQQRGSSFPSFIHRSFNQQSKLKI